VCLCVCACAAYPRSYFQVLHKFLTPKPRNSSHALGGANVSDAASAVGQNVANGGRAALNISDIRRSIERYNDAQQVLNEELFGPVQNDSLIIVVQVSHSLLPSVLTSHSLLPLCLHQTQPVALCPHSARSTYCTPLCHVVASCWPHFLP
jgi:hypothetical protein